MSQPALISLPLQRTPEVPFQTYKRSQAALARHRLYPLTLFYTLYAILVLTIALSTTHTWAAAAFFSASNISSTAMFCTAVFRQAKASSGGFSMSGLIPSTGIITCAHSMESTSAVS